MKTKQEQIEKMAVIGCVRNPQAHTAEECSKCDFKQGMCNAYRHAEALYNAGCSDVSEYKAKIDDLKDEIIYLERKIAIIDNALKDRDKAIEMLEGKQDTIVKQAKIDVLNKAKERAVGLAAIETYHICNLIDKIIKEVQDE